MKYQEINFDSIIGPTHNYSGLANGDIASIENKGKKSNPKKAALQGLDKMLQLVKRGIPQAVLPPQERPDIEVLRQLGHLSSPQKAIANLYKNQPELITEVFSSSAMWAANSATVSPSCDTQDGKTHITPANLSCLLHRSFEASFSYRLFKHIFSDEKKFAVHDYLPQHHYFGDEGAANHSRINQGIDYSSQAHHLFVYGRDYRVEKNFVVPRRQTNLASQTIALSHGLEQDKVLFLKQSSETVDCGVFHNDVAAVGNQNVYLMHEKAYESNDRLADIVEHLIIISQAEVSIADSVSSYLFNSQIVSKPDGSMLLLAPAETQELSSTKKCIKRVIESDNPINEYLLVDLHESMRNGGGPACLRLRVVLNQSEKKALAANLIADENLLMQLKNWVNKYYRDELQPTGLNDPALIDESYAALDELTQILDLGSIYNFQQNNLN